MTQRAVAHEEILLPEGKAQSNTRTIAGIKQKYQAPQIKLWELARDGAVSVNKDVEC
jgi:hypothetical protein